MAIVNCYIIHNLVRARKRMAAKDHHAFFVELQNALINITEENFTNAKGRSRDELTSPRPLTRVAVNEDHKLVQTADTRINGGIVRKRTRGCKVCTVFKVPPHCQWCTMCCANLMLHSLSEQKPEQKKAGQTSWYCPRCSEDVNGNVFLCNRPRGYPGNEQYTCAQIWHTFWHNGEFKPEKSQIRHRNLGIISI